MKQLALQQSQQPPGFCDECGAVVSALATLCSFCGRPPRNPYTQQIQPSVQVTAGLSTLPGSPPTGPLCIGSIFALRYRVLEQVGAGGFGTIYKAEDLDNHHRFVAIKQLHLDAQTSREMIEITDAYNREVRHLSRLRHTSLPRIYDSFTDPGHWYIVMDYIEGKTLEELLQKKRLFRKNGTRKLPVRQVLDIGLKLCDVLGYLHRQRPPIIFRDVKPGNIMVTKKGYVYLIDFGIARHYAPERQRDTGSLGTPGYAAPEQYGRAQTTERTDIYGLGATLQTLLTGKDPLELAQEQDTWWSRLRRRFQSKTSQRFQSLLDWMLDPDPAKRPQNTDTLRQGLLDVFPRPWIGPRLKLVLMSMRRTFADALGALLFLSVMLSFFFDVDNHPFFIVFAMMYVALYIIMLPLRLWWEWQRAEI